MRAIKETKDCFFVEFNFLATHLIFLRLRLDRSRRANMTTFIFSPDDKKFCLFMIPNFPKPMFLGQIHPGLVGTLTFCFSKN